MQSVQSAFKLALENALEGNPDYRVTLEVIGSPEKWVQLSWDTINAAYPVTQPPLETLAKYSIQFPAYVQVSEWRANEYVTFEHGAEPFLELVRFVEQYFSNIFGINPTENTLRIADDS